MRSTLLICLLAFALCVNARVLKRQKKIAKALAKPSPRGCQVSVDLSGTKSLLESAYGCLGTSGCLGDCGCQNIFLDEQLCGCNYGCNCDGYGLTEVSSCDRIPAIRLPKTLASIDARTPVPALNLPTLYQCDAPSCQNAFPYQILDTPCNCRRPNCDFLNPIDVPSPIINMPLESLIQTVIIETPRSVMKLPNCGCQVPVDVCGCQRQKCGCQLSALDIPCSCQMSALGSSCGCQLSAFDVPCGCQLAAFNLPCGCQLPGIDCGCQFQAFNSPCGCQTALGSPCGCQLPVPNVPYAFLMPSSDVPCAYQLSADMSIPPPVVGCGKYLRQVTLQPPFL